MVTAKALLRYNMTPRRDHETGGAEMKTIAISVLALAFAAGAYAQQGHKETDRLIKKAESMQKDLETATAQVHKTMDYYNNIMKGGDADTRKLYKDLTKAIEDSGKRAANVSKRVEEMEAEAHLFFGEWTQSLQEITSADLKKRAQTTCSSSPAHPNASRSRN